MEWGRELLVRRGRAALQAGIPYRRPTLRAGPKASVQAAMVSITVPKSGRSIPLQLIAAATGEMPFSIVYDVTVRWRTQQGQQLSDVNATTTHSSGPLSAYGHYIDWDRSSPAANWSADLDANARRFSETRHHGFSVRMDCEGPPGGAAAAAGVCAADGDVIETTMEFRSWSSTNVSAYTTVRTAVEALASCDNSRVWLTRAGLELTGDSTLAESPLEARVSAVDVDHMAINVTRADIELLWGGSPAPLHLTAVRGSNQYVATLSAMDTKTPGSYELAVKMKAGWNVTTGKVADCVLLRRTIAVEADTKSIILAGAISSTFVLVLAFGGYLLYKNPQTAKDFIVSFMSYELLLASDICLEAWDMGSDSFFFFEVRRRRSKAWYAAT